MIPRVIVSVTAAIVYINYKLGLMGLIEIAVKSARKSIPPQNPPSSGSIHLPVRHASLPFISAFGRLPLL